MDENANLDSTENINFNSTENNSLDLPTGSIDTQSDIPTGAPIDAPNGVPTGSPTGTPIGAPTFTSTGMPPNNSDSLDKSFVPEGTTKGYDQDNGSKLYPIVCTICGVLFVIGIYIYIFTTRNKKVPTGSRKKHNKGSNNSSGRNSSNDSHKIYIDGKSKMNFADTLNPKMESHDTVSPFSDTNYLIDTNRDNTGRSMNFMNKDYGEPPEYHHKNEHYPNPLFNHSKPIHPNKKNSSSTAPKVAPAIAPSVSPKPPKVAPPIAPANAGKNPSLIRSSIDTNNSDFSKNLNILSQEEAYLLRVKKNEELMGYPSLNQMNHNNLVRPNGNNGMPMSMQMLGNNGMQMNYEKQEKKMGDSIGEDSFYNDSFIKQLGNDIKIETKKIEYEDETMEGPINKLKIKRFNN